jgi:hypothetical protein
MNERTTTNLEAKVRMKSYVFLAADRMTILYRVQARDLVHAIEKFQAIYDISGVYGAGALDRVLSYAEHKAEVDCALEPMGLAPWQKRLNREERRNTFPLC